MALIYVHLSKHFANLLLPQRIKCIFPPSNKNYNFKQTTSTKARARAHEVFLIWHSNCLKRLL